MDTREAKIQRQHSQEMAIRYAALLNLRLKRDELRDMIDWFELDINQSVTLRAKVDSNLRTSEELPPSEQSFVRKVQNDLDAREVKK